MRWIPFERKVSLMSTKEMAYSIFSRLTDEQLEGFVAMFRELIPVANDDRQAREEAFEKMQALRRPISDLDEKKELEEYRTERYGA